MSRVDVTGPWSCHLRLSTGRVEKRESKPQDPPARVGGLAQYENFLVMRKKTQQFFCFLFCFPPFFNEKPVFFVRSSMGVLAGLPFTLQNTLSGRMFRVPGACITPSYCKNENTPRCLQMSLLGKDCPHLKT